jgi:hypothetical protein
MSLEGLWARPGRGNDMQESLLCLNCALANAAAAAAVGRMAVTRRQMVLRQQLDAAQLPKSRSVDGNGPREGTDWLVSYLPRCGPSTRRDLAFPCTAWVMQGENLLIFLSKPGPFTDALASAPFAGIAAGIFPVGSCAAKRWPVSCDWAGRSWTSFRREKRHPIKLHQNDS